MTRLVLDTNVVVSALLWNGPPRILLRQKRALFFTSVPLLAELADVLSRRKFEKKIAAALLSIDQIVERYAALTAVVRPTAIPRTAPEPEDDVVIGTAVAAKADLLVTGDRPLLLSIPEYEGVRGVGVKEALEIVAGGAGDDLQER